MFTYLEFHKWWNLETFGNVKIKTLRTPNSWNTARLWNQKYAWKCFDFVLNNWQFCAGPKQSSFRKVILQNKNRFKSWNLWNSGNIRNENFENPEVPKHEQSLVNQSCFWKNYGICLNIFDFAWAQIDRHSQVLWVKDKSKLWTLGNFGNMTIKIIFENP